MEELGENIPKNMTFQLEESKLGIEDSGFQTAKTDSGWYQYSLAVSLKVFAN